jgi:5'(3')-deoxyribonucleotidase
MRWEFYEDWGLDLKGFLSACHAGVDDGIIFAAGEPFTNVREAFELIKANGHTIHIVTDRTFGKPGASAAATIGWLARHDLPYDSITFSADKTVAQLDVMVDDKPSNYEALRAAGVDAYLLTRAWNSHVSEAQRVDDLLHFAEVIA